MIPRVTTGALFASFLLVVTACGTVANKNAPEFLGAGTRTPGNGIVLLTSGAKDWCLSAATFLKIMPEREPYGGRMAALVNVDGPFVKSEFSHHYGNVHALQLAAGRYYATPMIANPYIGTKRMPRWDFVVNADEVLYIGEFFVPVQCGPHIAGRFADRSDRDLPLFKSRMQTVDLSSIQTRIPGVPGAIEVRD